MRFWQLFGILVHPTVKEPKCCKILAWHLKRKKIHIVCTCLKSKILIPAYFWNCWISFNPHMSHFIQCNPSRPARSQINPPSPWQESHFMQARLTLSPYFCVCNSFHHWPTLCLFGRNGAYYISPAKIEAPNAWHELKCNCNAWAKFSKFERIQKDF